MAGLKTNVVGAHAEAARLKVELARSKRINDSQHRANLAANALTREDMPADRESRGGGEGVVAVGVRVRPSVGVPADWEHAPAARVCEEGL